MSQLPPVPSGPQPNHSLTSAPMSAASPAPWDSSRGRRSWHTLTLPGAYPPLPAGAGPAGQACCLPLPEGRPRPRPRLFQTAASSGPPTALSLSCGERCMSGNTRLVRREPGASHPSRSALCRPSPRPPALKARAPRRAQGARPAGRGCGRRWAWEGGLRPGVGAGTVRGCTSGIGLVAQAPCRPCATAKLEARPHAGHCSAPGCHDIVHCHR